MLSSLTPPARSGSSSNSHTWRIVVGVVVPVSLVLLLGLVAGTFMLMKRIRRLREGETLGKAVRRGQGFSIQNPRMMLPSPAWTALVLPVVVAPRRDCKRSYGPSSHCWYCLAVRFLKPLLVLLGCTVSQAIACIACIAQVPASSEQGSSQGGGTGGDSSDPEVGHHPRSASTEAVMPLIRAMEVPHGTGHLAAVHELRTASMHSLNSNGTASMQGSVSATAGPGSVHNGVDFLQQLAPLVLHPYAPHGVVPLTAGAVVSTDTGSSGADGQQVVRAATTGVLYPHYTLHPPPQFQSGSGVPPNHPWHISQGAGAIAASEPPGGPLSAFSSAKATPVWGSPAPGQPPSQPQSSGHHYHPHLIHNSRTLYGQMSAAGSVHASPSSTQESGGDLSRGLPVSPHVMAAGVDASALAAAGGQPPRLQRHHRAPSAGSSSRDGTTGPLYGSRGGAAGSSGTDRGHESSSSTPTQGLSGTGGDSHRRSSFALGGSAQGLRSVSGPPSSTQASALDPRVPGHQQYIGGPANAIAGAGPGPGNYGRISGGVGSEGSAGMDSFDQVPNDQNQLLIHRMEMSRELQVRKEVVPIALLNLLCIKQR
jgi:hypothetical protein